jgi:hypothetical protein
MLLTDLRGETPTGHTLYEARFAGLGEYNNGWHETEIGFVIANIMHSE